MLETEKYPNLYRIVECVLAIFVSNAFVERAFNIMKKFMVRRKKLFEHCFSESRNML
jgi:Tat protein secretion system quality control protein TatD with DNase activity